MDEQQNEQQIETVNFDDLHARVNRIARPDLYLALEPPAADPYIVAGKEIKPDDIVAFVSERLGIIRELRTDMIKRFQKSSSMECRFQTGDVAHLYGRPFMIRVRPLAKKKLKQGAHGRVNVNATMHHDVSVIDLYVMNTGDYDQRKLAFWAWVDGIFFMNARSITHGCAESAGIADRVPTDVRARDMSKTRVKIDLTHNVTWVSRELAPYPMECVAYTFMTCAAHTLYPDEADEESRRTLVATGCPTWQHARALLDDKDSPYARQ